ncbi:MAG: lipid-A-disaccharide synthase [bacterium]
MKKFFIVAGDPSGDMHASRLMQAIYNISPDTEFIGIGGREMTKAGLKSIAAIEEMSVVGFWEVAKKYGYFKKVLEQCSNLLKNEIIDAFIPVDYPGFNIRLSRIAKENKIPVIYYIAPQLWAWGKNRAKKIATNTDLLLTVFPFEQEFFSGYGIKTVFTGHPLLDNPVFEGSFPNYKARENIIALLPGSREQEISQHLPVMEKIAEEFSKNNPDYKIVIAGSKSVGYDLYKSFLSRHPDWDLQNDSIELMMKAKAGLVKTGTSNLEAALCGMPFIMIYKTSPVSYFLGKRLINLEYISLVNILLKKRLISEYIQSDIDFNNIYIELNSLLLNQERYTEVQEQFKKIRFMLGETGASKKAAEIIVDFLSKK